tara:strand:- start:204 stop:740 length:537 start_codon:yes stop_codon:yes gene_type:complete
MLTLNVIKKRNICIMGLMGSGKSIIGKDLSTYLNLKFYDTDKEIEIMTNKSISTIFEEKGELYFRDIEEKVCIELLGKDNCVISLGGGSIINKRVRKLIKNNSYSIYLKVELSNLVRRLKSSNKRPIMEKKLNKKEILLNLYNKRRKFYEKADFIVDNNNNKFQALKKIKSELNLYAN